MKIHDKLDEILNQGPKVKILRFLFTENDEHTGRGIANAINMSASSTHKALQEMTKIGVISARKKGKATLYKITKDNHVVKKLLIPLFEKEKTIYDDIVIFIKRALVKRKSDILSAAFFGSVAKKQETAKSDIDLVVIIKNTSKRKDIVVLVDDLGIDIAHKFGTALSPYILKESEIRKKYNKRLPLVVSIIKNNKLIHGEPIERIIA